MMDQPYLAWADRAAVDARVASVPQAALGYDDCEARYLYEGRPLTGFSATRYPDGSLRSLAGPTDGIEHGLTVVWYPDGQMKLFAETARAVYHGIVAEWAPSGELIHLTRYDEGLEIKSHHDSR